MSTRTNKMDATFWSYFNIVMHNLNVLAFYGIHRTRKKIFGISLGAMCISLLLSLWEVYISTIALNMELETLDDKCN